MIRATPSPLRFFAIVQQPPASIAVIALAVIAFGVYLTLNDPAALDQVVAITLFLQMFAASTGFRHRLRRGHFDPILVANPARSSIASAHWAVSIAPGLVTWLILAAIDLTARPDQWPLVLRPATLLAFLFVSTAVWAATLPFARLAGGALWVMVLFALAGSGSLSRLTLMFRDGGSTWEAGARQAAAALICPFMLFATSARVGPRALLIVGAATVAAWGVGLVIIKRCDGTLTDPS